MSAAAPQPAYRYGDTGDIMRIVVQTHQSGSQFCWCPPRRRAAPGTRGVLRTRSRCA